MTVATQSPEPASAQRGSHRRAPRRCWIVALACLLGLGVDNLSAQEDVTGTDDLRTRVEELERTNRALIQALRDQQVLEDDPRSDETAESDEEGFQFYPIADKADSKKKSGEGKSADKKASPPEEEWYEVGSDLSMSAS
jgi:predicted phage gp36 major capsid-like protein